MEVAQGLNIKQLSSISSKTVKNYLRAAASHATDNGMRDPRYRYYPNGHRMDGSKYFPMLEKLLSHMNKWSKGRSEALPLTIQILSILRDSASTHGPNSSYACTFDAICLGLQTGSRCSEYCKGLPTNKQDDFCKVPSSQFAGQFAGYPLAFAPEDISFLSSSRLLIPSNQALTQAAFVRIRFKFDKGGTGNLTFRTFKQFSKDKSDFCPLLAALRALQHWNSFQLHPLTPLFCHELDGRPTFLADNVVTAILRESTVIAYPNPLHLYRTRISDVCTHSLRVTAFLILVAARIPTASIEHRLRWASQAWKVYVRESLTQIDQAASSSFFTDLDDVQPVGSNSSQQAFDVDDIL